MCAKFINPSSAEIDVVCDCATGFYGIDFCEAIADFIRLPPFFSALAGAHLKHSALLNGAFDERNINALASRPIVQSPRLQNFSIPLDPSGRIVHAPINAVHSAFKTIDQDLGWDSLINSVPEKGILVSANINDMLPRTPAQSFSVIGSYI